MTGKTVDPTEGLAADAVLAEDLGDEKQRHLNQIAEMGGEIDDIDDFDPTGLDDGSDPDFKAPDKEGDSDDEEEEVKAEDDAPEDAGEGTPEADGDDSSADPDDSSEEVEEADSASDDDDESSDDDGEDEGKTPAAKGIPKRRFDEVNERRKAAEEENVRLKAQIEAGKPPDEQEVPYDVQEGEREYIDLMLDGKVDDALAKRQEIDAAKEAKWKAETASSIHTETDQTNTQAELTSMSTQAEKMYPVFDESHEDFQPEIGDKVIVYYRGYLETGAAKTPGDAFVLALADVVEQYGLEEKYHALGDPEPDPKPVPKPDKVDKKKEKIAEKAVTPVAGEGKASDDAGVVAPDINTMTDEELDALPPKALARLRGDIL